MRTIHDFELPDELKKVLQNAKKLEWITIGYLLSVILLMYLAMGSSQAMKSAWMEDILALIPSTAFLISTKINSRAPNARFPYGYHRVFSISFLAGAVALFGIGLFLVYDSSVALLNAKHPTIGNIILFGHQIWMGWIMIVVLLYSAIPVRILGLKKLPIAEKLHNKILYTDASTQKADYLTALAAILGIIGIAFGLWWADAVAALFISFSVLKDGYHHVKTAILDLMDRRPLEIRDQRKDPLIDQLEEKVNALDWVKEAKVRFREHGQVYFGEIAVVANEINMDKIEDAYETLGNMDWKLHDLSIVVVKELPKW